MAEFIQGFSVWGVTVTLGAFALGTWVNKKTGLALFNPLLLGGIFVMIFLSLVQIPLGEYRQNVQFLSYLLLPATVSLAIPLYEQWQALKENTLAILCGIAAGSLTSMCSIFVMSWMLELDPALSTSLMPKSVTTAIGAEVAVELGGISSLAGAMIIMTGMRMVEHFSIPFSTPLKTINAVRNINTRAYSTDCFGSVINPVKKSPDAAAFPSPVR